MLINISKAYGDNIIFKDLKIKIIENKINVIVGRSGCGKTTLLNCLVNLQDFEGTISGDLSSVSYLFQEDRLLPWLSVYKNLSIIDNNDAKIKEIASTMKISHLLDKYPNFISGGERQRIAMARAFLQDHSCLIMDEPFKSLDYELKWSLIDEMISSHALYQNTVIVVTHDLEEAAYMSDFIHILGNRPTELVETFVNSIPLKRRNLNNKSYGDLIMSIKEYLF